MHKRIKMVGLCVLSLSSWAITSGAQAESWCPDNVVLNTLIDVPFAVLNSVGYVFNDKGLPGYVLGSSFVPCDVTS